MIKFFHYIFSIDWGAVVSAIGNVVTACGAVVAAVTGVMRVLHGKQTSTDIKKILNGQSDNH